MRAARRESGTGRARVAGFHYARAAVRPPAPAPPLPRPARTARVAAVGMLMLALPFLFFGVWQLDQPALTDLACEGRVCVLAREGWLTRREVAHFDADALAGARVDRRRSARLGTQEYRPVVEVGGQKERLAHLWVKDEAGVRAQVERVQAYARDPSGALRMRADARRVPAIVGSVFGAVGAGLLTLAVLFALRGWRRGPA